jgi:hypothetical protein
MPAHSFSLPERGLPTRVLCAPQPDISPRIPYTQPARKWGRQASTGALMSVAMHAGLLMQLVKKRREKTIANNNQLALAA